MRTRTESHPRRRAPSMSVSRRSPIIKRTAPARPGVRREEEGAVGLADYLGPSLARDLDGGEDRTGTRPAVPVGGRVVRVGVRCDEQRAVLDEDGGRAELLVGERTVPTDHDGVGAGADAVDDLDAHVRERPTEPLLPDHEGGTHPSLGEQGSGGHRGGLDLTLVRQDPERREMCRDRRRGAGGVVRHERDAFPVLPEPRHDLRRAGNGEVAAEQHTVEVEEEGVVTISDHPAPACYTGCVPRIAPFEALIYDIDVAGPIERLTAPPYDVISESRRRAAREASPHSIVHVDLAEGSSDPGTPDNRYDRAAALLARWRAGGVLTRLSPSYLAYEMTFEDPPEPPGECGACSVR